MDKLDSDVSHPLDRITVVQAIAQLEARLTALINTAVTALSQQLHEALLAQERRNATFADRERLEAVARNAHDAQNAIAVNNLRISKLETGLADLRRELNTDTTNLLKGVNGYLITAAIAIGAVLLTYLLTHLSTGGHP